jgi:catechol 2,3-dioxygenase-like lactoylglutathione lyase family enzyme
LLCAHGQAAGRRVRNFEEALIFAIGHPARVMKIKLTSLMVDDQAKALAFYTDVLGFVKKQDFPAGEYRWITVVSPDGRDDLELSLEPNVKPAAKTFQQAMFAEGVPLAAFEVSDMAAEYARLTKAGVAFTQSPMNAGPVTIAIFADT